MITPTIWYLFTAIYFGFLAGAASLAIESASGSKFYGLLTVLLTTIVILINGSMIFL